MMSKMMDAMIRSMSQEEREQMMLQMMPEMMKKADLQVLIENMTVSLGKMISLYGLTVFIQKAAGDDDLRQEMKSGLNKLKSGLPKMMGQMMPVMKPLMKKIMPQMMGKMFPMMAPVMEDMKRKGECMMSEIVEEKPELKEHMGDMMTHMCPNMAAKVIPPENRKAFVKDVLQSVIVKHNEKLTEEELISFLHTEPQTSKKTI